MTGRRRERFVFATVAWLLATALVLSLLSELRPDLFVVSSLVGVLVVAEVTAPVAVAPAWRRRLRWVIAVGLAVFAYLVVRRILAILPPGVL